MLFNSLEFLLFLPTVFILYWFVFKKITTQNILILVSSYVFYGWWDWRFLSLILISTLIDYTIGIQLRKACNLQRRKLLVSFSLVFNLGMLGFFKYYNFFVDSWIEAWSNIGVTMHASSLNIILPVGISFYTFQTLSYTIDIYRKKLEPTRDFVAFGSFVSFFPQLVAGPIERATNLLPQFFQLRKFSYLQAVDGIRQMLWGLFKKVVIADNAAELANLYFNDSGRYSGSELALGALFFTFQIYGDFSGYSDIAIGVSRLFGFNLKRNFAFPYFSRDIAEFWRRWHISLSNWFRDYLYVPLGGSRGSTWMKVRNTFIIFLVSGFWHGANWTFVAWGALNAIYFLPLLLLNKNRSNIGMVAEDSDLPSFKEFCSILLTFTLTLIAWVFFRAENISHAISYLSEIFSYSIFTIPVISSKMGLTLVLIIFFVIIEWFGRTDEYAIEKLWFTKSRYIRLTLYYVLITMIFLFAGSNQQFIYFQF